MAATTNAKKSGKPQTEAQLNSQLKQVVARKQRLTQELQETKHREGDLKSQIKRLKAPVTRS